MEIILFVSVVCGTFSLLPRCLLLLAYCLVQAALTSDFFFSGDTTILKHMQRPTGDSQNYPKFVVFWWRVWAPTGVFFCLQPCSCSFLNLNWQYIATKKCAGSDLVCVVWVDFRKIGMGISNLLWVHTPKLTDSLDISFSRVYRDPPSVFDWRCMVPLHTQSCEPTKPPFVHMLCKPPPLCSWSDPDSRTAMVASVPHPDVLFHRPTSLGTSLHGSFSMYCPSPKPSVSYNKMHCLFSLLLLL